MDRKRIIIKITPRNPFRLVNIPLITRMYRWAVENGRKNVSNTLESRIIFLIFYLLQRFWPFKYVGEFEITFPKHTKYNVKFNAKNAQFEAIYLNIFKRGYEPEVMALLDAMVVKNDIFYDVGSNWGIFPLFLLSNPNFDGQIYAFEPFPSTFSDLKEVISQVDKYKQIHYLRLALSNEKGVAKMIYPGMLQSGFAQITKRDSGFLNPKAIVNVNKIDSLKLNPPTVLKIDAQFHESEVLKGAINILKKAKPIVIFENCLDFQNTNQTMDPLWLLESLGYQLYFPCWLDKNKSLIPSEADKHNYSSDLLALNPFKADERFLLREMINIVACYYDRTDKLWRR